MSASTKVSWQNCPSGWRIPLLLLSKRVSCKKRKKQELVREIRFAVSESLRESWNLRRMHSASISDSDRKVGQLQADHCNWCYKLRVGARDVTALRQVQETANETNFSTTEYSNLVGNSSSGFQQQINNDKVKMRFCDLNEDTQLSELRVQLCETTECLLEKLEKLFQLTKGVPTRL